MATSIRYLVLTEDENLNKVIGAPGVTSASNYAAEIFGTEDPPFPNTKLFMVISHPATINNIKVIVGADSVVWTDAAFMDKNVIRFRIQKRYGELVKQRAPVDDSWLKEVEDGLGAKVAEIFKRNSIQNPDILRKKANMNGGLTSIDGIGNATSKKIVAWMGENA